MADALFATSVSFALSQLKLQVTPKAEQLRAIRAAFDGRDVFVCLPTGFGKSLCYQALPFVMDHQRGCSGSAVIVVSPLIALMEDQVSGLRKRKVNASIMTSSTSVSPANLCQDKNLHKDSLFFASAEALVTPKCRGLFELDHFTSRIVAIVVDEAHCISKWSKDFRPAYGRLAELRALVPPGTPIMACTATATRVIKADVLAMLEMCGCTTVSIPPNRPNIKYLVRRRTTMGEDFAEVVSTLRSKLVRAPRVVVYCRTLPLIGDLFDHFSAELEGDQYYPPGAPDLCKHRLFAMYHAKTPERSKVVVTKSLLDPVGVVRVVFASVALGMGVDLKGVTTIIHYGAPSCIEDYFQASGRAGRGGESSKSIVYWAPSDCPMTKEPSTAYQREVNDVRQYVENSTECRRKLLLKYFDPDSAQCGDDPVMCCDVCDKPPPAS